MTTYVKVVGFAAAVMGLILLLLSLSVDTIVAVNEDGDTVQCSLGQQRLVADFLSFIEEDEQETEVYIDICHHQIKHNKHPYHMETELRLTEGFLGVPVSLDNLFEQILSLPTDDQGQNSDHECFNGSELSEMDMCLTATQAEMFASLSFRGWTGKRKRRQASANGFSLWKNGVIPYVFNSTFPAQERNAILGAMSEWEKATCVRFRPANRRDRNVVIFRDGRRCSTNIGCIGGRQTVTLAKTCRSKRILIHELGHVIGLIHEHQRHDRDKYVKVLLENVRNISQERYQFSKLLSGSITERAVKYDYTSIMHYGKNYFARSPELTTLQTTERAYQDVIGRAERPSFSDTETVNRLYQCSAACPPSAQCSESCYLDNVCTCRCPAVTAKAFLNGPSRFENHLLDSTCDLLASKGECAGNLKRTVRPLCAKSCELHEIKHSTPTLEMWTPAPTSNINHLQSKPAGSFWGTSPDAHRLISSGRNRSFHKLNNLNDGQLPSLAVQHRVRQAQRLPSQQPILQDQQFLPISDTQDQTRFISQLIRQEYRNTPSSGNLRTLLLQRQVTQRPPELSFLRSLIAGSSSNNKRLFNNVQKNNRSQQRTDKQSASPNQELISRKETTKAPSIFLDHLLISVRRDISLIKNYPFSGVSFWLNLTDIHLQNQKQQQMLQREPQNIHQTSYSLDLSAVSNNERLVPHNTYDLTHFGASTGENASLRVKAGLANRNSAGTSQAVEVRNGALPDPYHPNGPNTENVGRSEHQQKTSGIIEPIAAGMTGVMSFIGPENGPSEASTLNNTTMPVNDQYLQTAELSVTKYDVLPQTISVSEQNLPAGNPAEQVVNEPWNSQIQQIAPITEQHLGQTFRYFEPLQPQQSSDISVAQGGQQQETGRKDPLSNHGTSVLHNEPFVDGLTFHTQQLPIDQHPVSEVPSSPSQTAHNNHYVLPADSSQNGNTGIHQEQQLTPLLQPLNIYQSFTDPLASRGFEFQKVVTNEKHNVSSLRSELASSQNLRNPRQNPLSDSLHIIRTFMPKVQTLYNSEMTHANAGSAHFADSSNTASPHLARINGFLQDISPNSHDFLVSGLNFGSGYFDWISGLSSYTFPSVFNIQWPNAPTSQYSSQAVQQISHSQINNNFDITGYQKRMVHHATAITDPRENVYTQVVEENNGFVQQHAEEVSSQTSSGITHVGTRMSLDTALLDQPHLQ